VKKKWTLEILFFSAFIAVVLIGHPLAGMEEGMGRPMASVEGLVFEGLIFEQSDELPSSHASTVYPAPDGSILCAWYSGSAEANRDVAVWASRWQGGEWSRPEVIADTPGKPDGNPVLWVDESGKTWLFFVTIHGLGWNWAKIKYQTSDDGGETWGDVVMLRNKRGWMTRNHPITLSDGRILLPLYSENKWCTEWMESGDGGESWEVTGEVCSRPGNIQAAAVELDDGELYATMRTGARKGEGRLWQTRSHDGGRTWEKASLTDLPNPNAGTDMIKLKSGRLLLAFNNSDRGRTPLSLAVSDDGGRSWRVARDVESDPGEYSYPSLCQDGRGVVHLTYTYLRESIKHVAFTEAWVK